MKKISKFISVIFKNYGHVFAYQESLKYNVNIKLTKLSALFKNLFSKIRILTDRFYELNVKVN